MILKLAGQTFFQQKRIYSKEKKELIKILFFKFKNIFRIAELPEHYLVIKIKSNFQFFVCMLEMIFEHKGRPVQ